MSTLLRVTTEGLYCEAGDFHVDPWRAVPRAVVTHAHGDHVAWGCGHYLTSARGGGVLRERLGADGSRVETIPFGERRLMNGVTVSLHPAGHILGSAQVRVEHRGEVWVVSGDYKTVPDPTCDAWEPIRCHTFITESTFGLPVYRWPAAEGVAAALNAWWRGNADAGRPSLLFAYSLGKAQRLLASLDPSIGPILTHGAVERMTRCYRDAGIALPSTLPVTEARETARLARAVILAPPSADDSTWSRTFRDAGTAFASGWMAVRGTRRRRAVDRGFVLSDHVDWPGLLAAIDATGASRVWVTHGFTSAVVRWLTERGLDAAALSTRWTGDALEAGDTLQAGDAAASGDGAPTAP